VRVASFAVLKGELMEIAGLILALISIIFTITLCHSKAYYSDIIKLENKINELKSANKLIYKSLAEEYRDLTKANMFPDYLNEGVEFYRKGMSKEYIRYVDLQNKIKEVKALKEHLCNNTCENKVYTMDGSDSIGIDLSCLEKVTEKELEKYIGKEHLKKFRKQRKKK